MAEFPALPLWTDAYLGDTTHLSTVEHGAYLLLLMTAWRTADCALPDNDLLLARYARCDKRQWRALRPVLEPFFTIKNGKWRQGRLTDERTALQRKKEIAAQNGRASALKRKGRHSAEREQSDSEASTNGQQDFNLTTTTPSSVDKSTGGEPPQVPPDPVKELFELGVSILTESGSSDKQARSLIGKWRKDRSDGEVLSGLIECRNQAISNPVEWLTKRFDPGRYVSPSGYRYRGDFDAVIREAERRADWGTYWKAKGDRDGQRSAKRA